eukprot:600180-Rhodomonas_salina.1
MPVPHVRTAHRTAYAMPVLCIAHPTLCPYRTPHIRSSIPPYAMSVPHVTPRARRPIAGHTSARHAASRLLKRTPW